jgi:hypothetical protein
MRYYMFTKKVSATYLRANLKSVLEIKNEENIQVLRRAGPTLIIITEDTYLDLLMKAKGYESIMGERNRQEKVYGLDHESLSFDSISKLMDEEEKLRSQAGKPTV